MTKTKQFRKLLNSNKVEFLCEVHNGLSARIVEEAGFKGLWGSGLSISAAMGVRDNNEASWTQVLEIAEFISDASDVPLLLDADTGYGNFNNMRRLVKKLEQRGVAAVCIEDKEFPKTNSFIMGEQQPLANIEEFSGKIKAAKDAQSDPDFSVLARVEAFIAGWGLGEALKRADAYHRAGADGILIHSKITKPDEVLSFKKEWGDRSPVIIVPTKYYTTPIEVFEDAGFSIVIWANMILRSSIKSMQEIAARLERDRSLLDIEDKIAPLPEVFRLQNAEELQEAEKLYLSETTETTGAVILAASRGKGLDELTAKKPKAMLNISGKPLLYKQTDTLNEIGIKDITVVRGYGKETIDAANLKYVDNDDYDSTNEAYSLYLGIKGLDRKTLVLYGDILYKKFIPSTLLDIEGDFVIVVDANWKSSLNKGRYADYVSCDLPYQRHVLEENASLKQMNSSLSKADISGEWIGMLKLSKDGVKILKDLLEELAGTGDIKQMRMADLFERLIERGHRINVQYILGHWLDIDEIKDLIRAGEF
jgi:phosphoenolpyruvate phosphomutase